MQMEEENKENIFEIGEQVDCKDTVNKWLNAEIIAKRDNEVRVHYTQWSQKYDEWISIQENRILKQWELTQKLQINNRLDVKYVDESQNISIWLEAIVLKIDNEDNNKVFVHFVEYKKKYDQWMHLLNDKNNIAEVGMHSKAHGSAGLRKNNPKFQALQKKFIQVLKNKEVEFRNTLQNTKNWTIHEVEPDGNCLFRSVSHQLYNVEDYHAEIREYCMKYIEINKDYFKNFLIGGSLNFEQYINWKKQDGVWGDNIEIQAIREIYERPVEIYAYSAEPMRTFSENSVNNQTSPIRLSYHGQSHYNSINIQQQQFQNSNSNVSSQHQLQATNNNVPAVNEDEDNNEENNNGEENEDDNSNSNHPSLPAQPILSQQQSQQSNTNNNNLQNNNNSGSIQFGIIEENALKITTERLQQLQQQQIQQQQQQQKQPYAGEIAKARKDFEKIGNWNLDEAIKESFNLFLEKNKEDESTRLEIALTNDAILQVESMIDSETSKTLQESISQYEQQQIKLIQEQSKKEAEEKERQLIQDKYYQTQLKEASIQATKEYNDQLNQVLLESMNQYNNFGNTNNNSNNNNIGCIGSGNQQQQQKQNNSSNQIVKNEYNLDFIVGNNINNNNINNNTGNSEKNKQFIMVGDPMENMTILQILNNDLNMDISLGEAINAYEMFGENISEIIAYFCEKKIQ